MIKTEHGSVGEVFKQRRQEMNLSLKEIENATSIRVAHLQAIEEGEMSKLISPVYAQGFVRQYANYLGIDADKLVKEYSQQFKRPDPQDFAYGIGTLEMRGNPGGGVKWLPNLLWILISVGVVVGAWYLARYLEVL